MYNARWWLRTLVFTWENYFDSPPALRLRSCMHFAAKSLDTFAHAQQAKAGLRSLFLRCHPTAIIEHRQLHLVPLGAQPQQGFGRLRVFVNICEGLLRAAVECNTQEGGQLMYHLIHIK